MMPIADAQKLAGGAAASPSSEDTAGSSENTSDTGPEANELNETVTSKNEAAEGLPMDEAPTPALLTDFSRTEGNMPPPSTSEFSASEIRLEEPLLDKAAEVPDRYARSVESQTSDAAPVPRAGGFVEEILRDRPSSEPLESVAAGSSELAENTEGSTGARKSESWESEPTAETIQPEPVSAAADIPPLPEPPIPEPLIPAAEAVPADAVTEAGPVTGTQAEGSAEDMPDAVPRRESIEKPGDDLSSFDSYSSPSMFDSVRIMEPRGSRQAGRHRDKAPSGERTI